MADLKIKLTVDSKQYEDLVKKMKDGNITLKEMSELKRAVNSAFREAIPGTQQYKELEQVLAKINDRQRDVRLSTRAGNEAYFKAGLELRQLMLANFKFEGSLGKVSDALNNSVGAAIGFKAALVPLGISMGGVGLAFVAVAAFLPSLIKLFGETTTEAERLEKQFGKTEDRLRSLVKTRGRSDLKEVVEAAYMRGEISAKAWAEFRREMAIQAAKERSDKRKERAKDIVELRGFHFEELAEWKSFAERRSKIVAARPVNFGQGLSNAGLLLNPEGSRVGVGAAIEGMQRQGENTEKAKDQFEGFQSTVVRGLSPIQQGFNSLGNLLESKIVGKLRQSTSEFSQFVGGVLSGLSQIATQLASSALVSLLGSILFPSLSFGGIFSKMTGLASGGIIPEPVLGRGLQSGRMYSFGERGPERVGPNVNQIGQASRFGGGGGRDGNVFVVENRITDTGLSTFVRRGDRKLTKRSY